MTTPSIVVLAQRLAAVEARLAEIETGYGQVIYSMQRRMVRTELNVTKIVSHLGLTPATEDEVDAVLDES